MGSRILIEILVLLSPFAIYGLYRMALSEAAAEGKKPWPIQRLFIIGFVLAVLVWVVIIFLDDRTCKEPNRIVDGEVVQGKVIPCERDIESIGVPASDDPGGSIYEPATSGEDDDKT